MNRAQFNPMRNKQQVPKTRRSVGVEMARPTSAITAKNTNSEEENPMEMTANENAATLNQEENMSQNATVEACETNAVGEAKQMTCNPTQVSNPQQEVKLSSLRHLSSSKKINELRKAILAGISREDICFEGQISATVFDRLYFNLCHLDGKFYYVAHKSRFLNGKIQEKGFYTSMDKIGALGLSDIFHEGAEIKYAKSGNSLVIEVIEGVQLTDNLDDLEDTEDTEVIEAQEEEMAISEEEMECDMEAMAEIDDTDQERQDELEVVEA